MVDTHCFYIFMSKLWRYLGNITGSSAYWHKVREDLKAIIAYKEAPTSFFLHFPQLIYIGQICTPFLVSNQTLLTLKKEGWIQGQKKHLGTSLNSTKLHSRKTYSTWLNIGRKIIGVNPTAVFRAFSKHLLYQSEIQTRAFKLKLSLV